MCRLISRQSLFLLNKKREGGEKKKESTKLLVYKEHTQSRDLASAVVGRFNVLLESRQCFG